MLDNEYKQFCLYSLYSRISGNYILKQINNVVDFGLVNELLVEGCVLIEREKP